MKISGIILAFLILAGMAVRAQQIYIRAGLGIAASTAAFNTTDYNITTSSAVYTTKKQGLGTGMPFVVAAGYNFSKHFALELGVDYIYGFSLKQTGNGGSYSTDSKWHGQMLSIVPAFVMSLPLDKFKPYARLGLKLGVLSNVIYQRHEINTGSFKLTGDDGMIKSKDYGGVAIGAQAALGTDFVLGKVISLFGEIQLDGISYSPKHYKYTEYTKNGVDQLATMTVSQKQFDYVKETDLMVSSPDDQPAKLNRTTHQFGNIGLVLGVKVTL